MSLLLRFAAKCLIFKSGAKEETFNIEPIKFVRAKVHVKANNNRRQQKIVGGRKCNMMETIDEDPLEF